MTLAFFIVLTFAQGTKAMADKSAVTVTGSAQLQPAAPAVNIVHCFIHAVKKKSLLLPFTMSLMKQVNVVISLDISTYVHFLLIQHVIK